MENKISKLCEISKVIGGKILEIDYLEDFDTNLGLYQKILELIESDTFEADGFLDEMIEFVLDNYKFEYEDGVWITKEIIHLSE